MLLIDVVGSWRIKSICERILVFIVLQYASNKYSIKVLPGLKGSGSNSNCKEKQTNERSYNMKLQILFVCW